MKTTLHRIDDEVLREGFHDETRMRRYEVRVDGQRAGVVGQSRSATRHGYANSRLGYDTWRNTWYWNSDDNAGDYEFDTRKAAVEDLVGYAVSLDLVSKDV